MVQKTKLDLAVYNVHLSLPRFVIFAHHFLRIRGWGQTGHRITAK